MKFIILFIAIAIMVIILINVLTGNRKQLKQLRTDWKKGSFQAPNEEIDSVKSYWHNQKEAIDHYDGIDELTWDDLSMQQVFEKLNYTQTSLGSEYLFNQLRNIDPALTDVAEKEELYTLLKEDQQLREKVLLILTSLGKRDFTNTSSYFSNFDGHKIKYPYMYAILAVLPLLSIALIFFDLQVGVMSLIISFVVNLAVYYRNKKFLEQELNSITYVASIVSTGKSLASIKHSKFAIFKDIFSGKGKGLRQTSFWGKILAFPGNRGGDFDVLFEYIRIVFLLDFIAYNQIVKTLITYRKNYKQLWEAIGKLDAAIAIAFYRHSVSRYTTPGFENKEELIFEDLAHPLLDHPVTNSSALGKNVLITGSNASGKSTYIKAIAINAILAQTINTVLATRWTMKPSYIVTSMAIEDSVLDGDSYFIAEIKSLKRIIHLSERNKPFISFIDEILKGTNTIERIAASAAIMKWLAANQGMTMIASHDIELTEIAGNLYNNYHFRETIEENEIYFDYKIHPGPSMTRNAIKLLDILDYPENITTEANQFARHFTDVREWQTIGR